MPYRYQFQCRFEQKISFEKVEKCLGNRYEYTHLSLPQDKFSSSKSFDAVAVCGGDGTLASIIQDTFDKPIKVFYFPVGTLNDKAKAVRYANARAKCPSCDETPRTKPIVVGKLNALIKDGDYLTTDCGADIFTYVLASGSFTPIGYTSTPEEKKRFGTLAYIAKIVKEYKPYRMKTSIICDKKNTTASLLSLCSSSLRGASDSNSTRHSTKKVRADICLRYAHPNTTDFWVARKCFSHSSKPFL